MLRVPYELVSRWARLETPLAAGRLAARSCPSAPIRGAACRRHQPWARAYRTRWTGRLRPRRKRRTGPSRSASGGAMLSLQRQRLARVPRGSRHGERGRWYPRRERGAWRHLPQEGFGPFRPFRRGPSLLGAPAGRDGVAIASVPARTRPPSGRPPRRARGRVSNLARLCG